MRPQASMIGADGNIYNLMGIATKSLRHAGFGKEMINMVIKSDNYEHALCVLMEYIEPVNVELQEEQDKYQKIS